MRTAQALGLVDLLLLGLLLAVAGSLGRRMVRRLGAGSGGGLQSAVFSVALGLGLLAYATLILGVLRLCEPWLFRLLFFLLVAAFLPGWIRARPRNLTWPGARFGVCNAAAGLLLLLYAGVYLVAALAPETGFDALNYHLGIPRLYIAAGGVGALPNLFYSNFPLTLEMLYTLSWLLHSSLLAKLVHFAFGLLVVAAIVSFSERFLSREAGLLAGCIFLASPVVGYLASTAYVDLGLTLYFFLALYALRLYLEEGQGGWLALCGVFSGLALSTKYSGAVVIVVIVALAAGCAWRERRLPARRLLACSLWPVLVFLPWAVKNVVIAGNPVAPLLGGLIPGPFLNASDYNVWMEFLGDWRGFPGTWWDYLRLPWLLTSYPDRFQGNPGPAFLLFLPLVLATFRRRRVLTFLALAGALGYLLLLPGTLQLRFFVPLFPVLAILVAGGLETLGRRGPGRLLNRALWALLFGLLLLYLPPFSPFLDSRQPSTLQPEAIRLFHSARQRGQYLDRQLAGRGVTDAYAFLNRDIRPGGGALPLTAGYQALLDHPLHMLPNSSAATALTRQVLEQALESTGHSRLQIRTRGKVRARLWRIEVPASLQLTGWRSYRPRLFTGSGPRALEHSLARVRFVEQPGSSFLELDLGRPRSVGEIRIWERLQEPETAQRLLAGEEDSWKEVDFSLRTVEPAPPDVERLAAACRKTGVTHIFFSTHLQGLDFLEEFFALPEVEQAFESHTRGSYRILRLTP